MPIDEQSTRWTRARRIGLMKAAAGGLGIYLLWRLWQQGLFSFLLLCFAIGILLLLLHYLGGVDFF